MLAMAQSRMVAEAIRLRCPRLDIELVPVITRGDRMAGRLAKAGGKGLFTAELEAALRAGIIDLAVHSAKDIPTAMAEDLMIVAVPARGDPRDALVSRTGLSLSELPTGARVATGSLRRRAQLLAARGDLAIVPIRGNVDTRVGKVLSPHPPRDDQLDAVVLAMAGLMRSGLAEKHAGDIRPLDAADFVPAAGQGALAVQVAAANREIAELVSVIDDADSHQAFLAERQVLRALGADCHSCVAVYIFPQAGVWNGFGMVGNSDGTGMIRAQVVADSAELAAGRLIVRIGRRGNSAIPGQ
jgi:hydroxymethylbilane synthase